MKTKKTETIILKSPESEISRPEISALSDKGEKIVSRMIGNLIDQLSDHRYELANRDEHPYAALTLYMKARSLTDYLWWLQRIWSGLSEETYEEVHGLAKKTKGKTEKKD